MCMQCVWDARFLPLPPSLTPFLLGRQGMRMRMELASLPPLQVPKVSVPRSKQGEGLATQQLYRQSSQLLETLYQMSANAKVVDMKQAKSGRSCASAAGAARSEPGEL